MGCSVAKEGVSEKKGPEILLSAIPPIAAQGTTMSLALACHSKRPAEQAKCDDAQPEQFFDSPAGRLLKVVAGSLSQGHLADDGVGHVRCDGSHGQSSRTNEPSDARR
jgi:hypothetical protein